MPRWLKISLRLGGLMLSLFLMVWTILAAYVYTHKQEILKSITSQLNEDLNGKLSIRLMEPSLIRGFPGISVALEDVQLRDSLWSIHKHDLLRAKNVFVAVNAFSILSGSASIRDIKIKGAEIYLFTDSNGIRNTDIFKKKGNSDTKGGGLSRRIGRVYLNHVKLTIDDRLKNKLFKFRIKNFQGMINHNRSGWKAHIELQSRVDFFAFNMKRGSFLKNKNIELDLDMTYLDKEGQLSIPLQKIRVGRDDLNVSGLFNFGTENSDFQVFIEASSILFKDAAALLSSHIISVLKPYGVEGPLEIQARLNGRLIGGGEPLMRVSFKADHNILSATDESITECSFTGFYTNELRKGHSRRDPNSMIVFYNMKGKFYDIPFKADSIQISDLRNPVFAGKFKATFPMIKLNKIFGENSFLFSSGTADLDLIYRAPFNQADNGKRYIHGTIRVHDAAANYKPRNLLLKDIQLLMNFRGNDLFLQNLKVKSGTTSLSMEAVLRNFSNLYYTDPHKILIDWKIKSPSVNLNEFMVFLGKRKTGSNLQGKRMSDNLDRMLEQSSMRLDIDVGQLTYKNFRARDLRSNITLKQSGIEINRLSLKQGGGSLEIRGNIDQSGSLNQFNIDSKIGNVNVEHLFYAFENFGQDAITDKNLRGTFFGSTSVSGSMYDDGRIVPHSLRAKVSFDIRNGALVNFEPMYNIGAFAFPNRNFSYIRFMNLKNTLSIQQDKVNIPSMEISSSVLNIFLEGIYSFSTGTDIALRIPLRNPRKDKFITDSDEKRERSLKGIVIKLRAVDGEDGKVKIRLGKKTGTNF
ncbi:MAG: AsmA-like C-terminal region-containing protein [Pedobacter sp.]|jgi:hypothetical protein